MKLWLGSDWGQTGVQINEHACDGFIHDILTLANNALHQANNSSHQATPIICCLESPWNHFFIQWSWAIINQIYETNINTRWHQRIE
jgi:hypothetical protein